MDSKAAADSPQAPLELHPELHASRAPSVHLDPKLKDHVAVEYPTRVVAPVSFARAFALSAVRVLPTAIRRIVLLFAVVLA